MMARVLMLALWCVCVLSALVALLWMLLALLVGSQRAKHIAFGFDQTANTAFGGHWDETISSRAWRERHNAKRWWLAYKLIDTLFWFDPNHCQKSYETEKIEAREWLSEVAE